MDSVRTAVEKSQTERGLIKLEKSFKNLNSPNVYQIFDFAQFLKNNENVKTTYFSTLNSIEIFLKQSYLFFPKNKTSPYWIDQLLCFSKLEISF